MADQEAKKKESLELARAINQIAETQAGQLFFRWLANQCHANRSTIVGNPQTFEINTLGSVCQAYAQGIYLKIRRAMSEKIKQKIEQ